MNKLFIEVNNLNVKATIYTQRNNSWELLLSEIYDRDHSKWSFELANDVREIDPLLMENYSMMMNMSSNFVKVIPIVIKSLTNNEEKIVQFIENKVLKGFTVKMEKVKREFKLQSFENGLVKGFARLEYISSEEKANIISSLMKAGFTRKHEQKSMIDAFESANEDKGLIINLHIDSQSSFITTYRDGKIIEMKKKGFAISQIYDTLQVKLGVNRKKAIHFFKNYGSIPPTNVRDNRIIHSTSNESGEFISYDKKELSAFITDKIDQFIKGIEKTILNSPDINIKVVYSGEITTLRGANDYISSSLGLTRSSSHESEIFGFSSVNNILTDGIIKQTKMNEKEIVQKNSMFSTLKTLFIR